jgi:hypothetical protein
MNGPDQPHPTQSGEHEEKRKQSETAQASALLRLAIKKRGPMDMNEVNVAQML